MIQLYRSGNTAFNLDNHNPYNLRMVSRAQLDRSAMAKDNVDITLNAVSPVEFDYRDYIIVDGRPYFLNLLPKASKDDKYVFTYNLNFEGGMYELGRVTYTMAGLNGWDYIGSLYDYCCFIINDMNRNSLLGIVQGTRLIRSTGKKANGMFEWVDTQNTTRKYYSMTQVPADGDMLYTLNGLPDTRIYSVGGGWTLDFEIDPNTNKPLATEEKALTYDQHTCLAVLQDLVAQWDDWEFYVEVKQSDICTTDTSVTTQCGGKIIMRRKAYSNGNNKPTGIYINGTNATRSMSYGKKGGLCKITREWPSGSVMPSRIYFYGGTRNLPTTYRNTRVCLPSASKETSYIDSDFMDNKMCEVVKVFDDIYPACHQFSCGSNGALRGNDNFNFTIPKDNFFAITALWQDPEEVTPSQYGSYAEWLLTYGTGDSATDKQRYLDYYYAGDGHSEDFPKNCYVTGDVMITFQTGDLAGMSFKVHEFSGQDANNYEITLNRNGVDTPFENVNYIPNEDLMCKIGDKFILEGCLMPASYVYANFGSGNYAAETLLKNAAEEYIQDITKEVKISVEISQYYTDTKHAVFRLYDGLKITDTDILDGFGSTWFKVTRVVHDILKNSYNVEIDDGRKKSAWSAISRYIARLSRQSQNEQGR